MKIIASVVAVAALASAAAPAFAQTLGEGDFVRLSRCAGLAEGIGRDAAPFKETLKGASRHREEYVLSRADAARRAALREAQRSQGEARGRIEAELSGACSAFAA